uniref:vasculin-like n=1 Tax=Styela clava TaxID=7725 RepID=UPI001939D675|nr:vasculin-like [Styela clava]
MAKDPHEAVDFSPAWLNFNNSNKKKSSEKSSGNHLSSQSSISPSIKTSQESIYRTNSLGLRSSGSPSRTSGHPWGQHTPSPRSVSRHQSVDLTHSYLDSKNDHFNQSPNREHKSTFTKSGTFSPTLPPNKKQFSANPWTRNGSTSAIDADFPSLSDIEVSDQKKSNNGSPSRSSSTAVVNMWQKPLVMKNKVTDTSLSSPNSNQKSTSIYKTLVPKAAVSHQKQPYRRTMSVPLNFPTKNSADLSGDFISNGNKRELGTLTRTNQSSSSNISPQQPRQEVQTKSSAVDIGVVSGHKKHRKGKNHFLKALRQTDGEVDDSAGRSNYHLKSEVSSTIEEEQPQAVTNQEKETHKNMDTNGKQTQTVLAHDDFVLSSSLEAEHRLLREMGWKCSDEQTMEEDAPLTEDEIKEFQMRCNGILSTSGVKQKEKALQNAFSGWKFPGIRKQEADADIENNNTSFLLLLEDNAFPQDDDNLSDNEF